MKMRRFFWELSKISLFLLSIRQKFIFFKSDQKSLKTNVIKRNKVNASEFSGWGTEILGLKISKFGWRFGKNFFTQNTQNMFKPPKNPFRMKIEQNFFYPLPLQPFHLQHGICTPYWKVGKIFDVYSVY